MNWNELQAMRSGWERCLHYARYFSDHYSLDEEQQEYVYRYAIKVPPGGVALEVGVCNGKTAAVLAHCAGLGGFEAHGIDAFVLECSADAINGRMREAGLTFHLHYGLSNQHPVPGKALATVPWDRPVDLLIVDAGHMMPHVEADCARWCPLVKPGGVVMFHDYDGAPDPGSCHYAVRMSAERHTYGWPMEYFVNGLMIKRRPR